MKTIKDILKADSYEQRRRIANNLAISREDKNALIVNQSNGGGGSSNQKLVYYKNNRFDDINFVNFYYLFSCTPIIEMLVGNDLNNDDSLKLTFVTNPLYGFYMKNGDDRFIVGFVIDTSRPYLCSTEGLFVNTSGTMQQRYQQIIDFLNNDTEYDNKDIISEVNEEWNLWSSAFTECTKEEYEALITIKPISEE